MAGDALDLVVHTKDGLDPAIRSTRTLAALALVVVVATVDWRCARDASSSAAARFVHG